MTALTVPDDGIDINRGAYEDGFPFFNKSGVGHEIEFIESPALPFLDKLQYSTLLFFPFLTLGVYITNKESPKYSFGLGDSKSRPNLKRSGVPTMAHDGVEKAAECYEFSLHSSVSLTLKLIFFGHDCGTQVMSLKTHQH
ncbi:hypothetical protein Ancab_016945 [Ancistrocladus abbreviatus]